jgi:hypothetical protein
MRKESLYLDLGMNTAEGKCLIHEWKTSTAIDKNKVSMGER